jgi:hypothetical protein
LFTCLTMLARLGARSRRVDLVGVFLFEGPPDAAHDLGGADGTGQVGAFGELVHPVLPELWTLVPGVGVLFRVDDGHDAVSDENHGGEVLGAGWAGDQHA